MTTESDTTNQPPTGFLEEAPGVKSSGRLLKLLAFVVCIVVPIFVWGYTSLTTKTLVVIPREVSEFCIGALLTVVGGHTAQTIWQKQ